MRTTRYHMAHDQMGRAWITFDGHEFINMCSFAAEVAQFREETHLQLAGGCTDFRNPEQQDGYYIAHNQAKVILREKAIFDRGQFNSSLFNYLNLSIEQILSSPDPIIRAIGMLDRRVGKRRLSEMEMADENPLVIRLHSFRLEAERLDAKR